MLTTSRPTTTLYTNTAVDVEAVGQAYASIKIKTPNIYHKNKSKLYP
jgi:hypothetical protein